jgi:hypothetical protein
MCNPRKRGASMAGMVAALLLSESIPFTLWFGEEAIVAHEVMSYAAFDLHQASGMPILLTRLSDASHDVCRRVEGEVRFSKTQSECTLHPHAHGEPTLKWGRGYRRRAVGNGVDGRANIEAPDAYAAVGPELPSCDGWQGARECTRQRMVAGLGVYGEIHPPSP